MMHFWKCKNWFMKSINKNTILGSKSRLKWQEYIANWKYFSGILKSIKFVWMINELCRGLIKIAFGEIGGKKNVFSCV